MKKDTTKKQTNTGFTADEALEVANHLAAVLHHPKMPESMRWHFHEALNDIFNDSESEVFGHEENPSYIATILYGFGKPRGELAGAVRSGKFAAKQEKQPYPTIPSMREIEAELGQDWLTLKERLDELAESLNYEDEKLFSAIGVLNRFATEPNQERLFKLIEAASMYLYTWIPEFDDETEETTKQSKPEASELASAISLVLNHPNTPKSVRDNLKDLVFENEERIDFNTPEMVEIGLKTFSDYKAKRGVIRDTAMTHINQQFNEVKTEVDNLFTMIVGHGSEAQYRMANILICLFAAIGKLKSSDVSDLTDIMLDFCFTWTEEFDAAATAYRTKLSGQSEAEENEPENGGNEPAGVAPQMPMLEVPDNLFCSQPENRNL